MKFFCLFASILFLNTAYAQQIFQGEIVYQLHTPQDKNDAELTIQYGPNKIKVKFKEKEDYDETYLMLDLDSGLFYTINTESKTFQVKKLAETNAQEPVLNSKSIAGYITNPVNVSGSGFSGIFGFSGPTILYTAPELYFPIPKKHAGAPQLIMIQNNHIVLGAEISMAMPGISPDVPDSVLSQMKVTAEAKKVTSQQWDIAEFSIPKDFTSYNMQDWPTVDSVVMDSIGTIDSLPEPPPPSPPAKKKTNNTPKKTTPTKTEAIKPKKTVKS